jgi:GH25 family lysozyme M1 (1,4-beta-N-acetylmuramidase)
MPNVATAIPSARRLATGSALVILSVVFSVVPVTADQSVRREPAPASEEGGGSGNAAPPIATRDEALAAGGRRADGPRSRTVVRQGIDVSHWQGRIDWKKVADGGVDFAIAKATEGTWLVDEWYERNREGARRAGVLFTAYHYANPGPGNDDAKREADFFLRHARLDGRHLVPALDLEETGGLGPAQLQRWALQWLRRVEHKLGVKPMLYISPGFWTGSADNSRSIARAGFRTLWISHWDTRRPDIPASRWVGTGWTIWQWTETGSVPGVTGWVDRNVYSGPRLQFMTISASRNGGTDDPGGTPRHDRPRRPAPR